MKLYDENMNLIYEGASLEAAADAVHNDIWGSSMQASAHKRIQAEVDHEMSKLPQHPINQNER